MKRTPIRVALGILPLVCLLAPGTVLAKGPGPDSFLAANLNTTLEPGVSHSWVIGPSSAYGGCVPTESGFQKLLSLVLERVRSLWSAFAVGRRPSG
jgi:hypothetical protein